MENKKWSWNSDQITKSTKLRVDCLTDHEHDDSNLDEISVELEISISDFSCKTLLPKLKSDKIIIKNGEYFVVEVIGFGKIQLKAKVCENSKFDIDDDTFDLAVPEIVGLWWL